MLTPTQNPPPTNLTNTRMNASEPQNTEDMVCLEQAWDWLCQCRKTAPDNADIWDLRFHWVTQKPQILAQLQAGTYHLTPMQVVGKARQVMWSAKDALALKWCALALQQTLPLHSHCEHVKGHGGGKTSIQKRHRDITQNQYPWVCRTDIKGDYGNINKTRLLQQLKHHVPRHAYLNLLTQYVHYSVEDGGEFYTPEQGIARGCALSPLLGAFHLWALDNHFARQKKISYARYMDDFIIMAKTRWSLRHQIKRLNQFFSEYGFKQHPDKTFIGKVEKGFDWLGGQFGAQGLEGISPRSQTNHVERLRRLYEQTRHWGKDKQQARMASYRKRWLQWIGSFYLGGALFLTLTPPTYSAYFTPNKGDVLVDPLGTTPPLLSPGVFYPNVLLPAQPGVAVAIGCVGGGGYDSSYPHCTPAANWGYTATALTIEPGLVIPANSYYSWGTNHQSYAVVTSAQLSITWWMKPWTGDWTTGGSGGNDSTFLISSELWRLNAPDASITEANQPSSIITGSVTTQTQPGAIWLTQSNAGGWSMRVLINALSANAVSNWHQRILVRSDATGGPNTFSQLNVCVAGACWGIFEASTVYISPTCTSAIPAAVSVPFGSVSNKSAGQVITTWGPFNPGITCDYDARSSPVTYRFTSGTADSNGNLPLTTLGGQPVGAVAISKDVGSDNACVSSTSKIKWNALPQTMYTPTGVNWWDNFFFQLCSDGVGTTGPVSSVGTFEIWYP